MPERPWWDRALDPLRHEESMFHVLVAVAAIAGVLIAIVLVARTLF
jgi:hypothetical protein